MTVLFGHPAGNPNSHHAALAHYEAGWLEAFCVPWMPSRRSLQILGQVARLRPMVDRLARRHFPALLDAPRYEQRLGEIRRLALRALGAGDERLAYQANDWLMRTMRRECRRRAITAVHAYEDCSLWQFREAKRRGKACLYDMPIGYYPAWQDIQAQLARKYADWLPKGSLQSDRYVRPEQKRAEMQLADLVLVPSSFAERTIRCYCPAKSIARAPYGVDLDFWTEQPRRRDAATMRIVYAGQISIRKGIPELLLAWQDAGLRDAELLLVGSWLLSDRKRASLPNGVTWHPPCAPEALRSLYRSADLFILPSHFEGFGLALLEAMACGLPAMATAATIASDILPQTAGYLVEDCDRDLLVDALRRCAAERDRLPLMGKAARACAEACTWENYRRRVREAVAPFV